MASSPIARITRWKNASEGACCAEKGGVARTERIKYPPKNEITRHLKAGAARS